MKLFSISILAFLSFFHSNILFSQEQLLDSFAVLDAKIKQTELNSLNIQSKMDAISFDIVRSNSELMLCKDRIGVLKSELSDLLYVSYFNLDKLSQLTYILSSQDFISAFRRILLIDQLIQFRQVQINALRANTKRILVLDSLLQTYKNKQRNFYNLASEVVKVNTGLRNQYDIIANKLLQDRVAYAKIQNSRNILNAQETNFAEDKITLYNTELHQNKAFVLSSYNKENMSFYQNKGLLLSPLLNARVISVFGERAHPVLSEVKIRNDGITLSSKTSSDVRVVFDGIVVNIYTIPGSNFTVLVAHGDYFTLYSNLDAVLVNSGDKVTTSQVIGTLAPSTLGQTLRFQIWKGKNRLNPSNWLKR
jgi:murein DD-endopeptidase MepM/ murein hydrolase activator NlpD